MRLLNVGCTRPAEQQIEFRHRTIATCSTCAELAKQWLELNVTSTPAEPGRPPRDTADQPRPPGTLELSRREKEVLGIYARGAQAKQIARELQLSESTVWQYLRRVRQKYHSAGREAQSRVDLYTRAVEDGLLTPPATTVFADLVETLHEIPLLHEDLGRDELIQLLRPEISATVPLHAEARLHLIALVRTCQRYDGGLADLLAAVEAVAPGAEPTARLSRLISR